MAYIIHNANNNNNNNNDNHKTNNSIEILKWKQMLEKTLLFLNLSVTLWVFSHSSWFPITLHALSFFHSKLLILFNSSFYTFLLLNAILLSLFAFSKTKNDAVSDDDDNDYYYNQYLNHAESSHSHHSHHHHQSMMIKDEEDCNNNVQPVVTCSEGTGTCYDQEVREVNVMTTDETVTTAVTQTATTATTTTTTTTTCYTALSMTSVTGGDKASGEKCYRRTKSGNVERRRMVAELKRFNTGLGREERSCHVEQLSKEEFNRTVEDFIAKHKRMLLEEQRKTEEA